MAHLHAYVKEYYKQLELDSIPIIAVGTEGKTNKYDVPTNPDQMCCNSPAMKATNEINQIFAINNFCFLSKIRGVQTMIMADVHGQPKEPKYEFDLVIERGDDFYVCDFNKLNHTNFICKCGYFDI